MSLHVTTCHLCQAIYTASQFHAAVTMPFAKNTQRSASNESNEDGGLQSAAPATKNPAHVLQTLQEYCACHTKQV